MTTSRELAMMSSRGYDETLREALLGWFSVARKSGYQTIKERWERARHLGARPERRFARLSGRYRGSATFEARLVLQPGAGCSLIRSWTSALTRSHIA
jgi:hypothetical protein